MCIVFRLFPFTLRYKKANFAHLIYTSYKENMKLIFFLLSPLLLTWYLLLFANNPSWAQIGQLGRQPNDLGIPGTTQPKNQKIKNPKIKYDYHSGKALLKSGLIIEGKFRYLDHDKEVPQYQFIENGNNTVKKVALSMVERLTLKGAEPNITHRNDSTVFVWIDRHRDLYRVVREGEISVYDNSRVVNETYDYLNDYIMVVGRENYAYKVIRQLSDLESLMTDRPYFIQSARATNRYDTKDFRPILYLIDIFNDKNAAENLAWDRATIELRNGNRLSGYAYIQPLDLRNEHTNTVNAYVHFTDNKTFQLFTQSDIKSLTINGIPYKDGFYAVTNKYFFGAPWQYNGEEYLVTERILNTNNYYFRNRTNKGQALVIMKDVAGNCIKPLNEPELRQQYMAQMGIK